MENRREFFKKAACVAIAATLPTTATWAAPTTKSVANKPIKLKPGSTFLFQGDSVTDCGRERNSAVWEKGLGGGYPRFVISNLITRFPEYNLTFINRGISGNKVPQLQERWQTDCLSLKPDVLSILIGVNDYWHMRDGHYQGSPESYETAYRQLLTDSVKQLPQLKLIICEPFALVGVGVVSEEWRNGIKPYQEAAQRLAKEFKACFVPFQSIFEAAEKEGLKYGFPSNYWTGDGIHPSTAGHTLMANAIAGLFK